ncbi:MAG: GDSL-type esterase/lipase family protein [Chloroflexota bacterium]|nr:GDSL-type esterase/lipase family protein [Chloroflexota bacterium]
MPRRVFQWWTFCLGLALLLAIGFVLWYSAPETLTKDFAYADTTVGLTVSRGNVLFPGECITMRWDVMNTRRIMIGDELMPAAGDTTVCIDATAQPALQVMLMDGSEVKVTQPINILATHSTFVTLALLTLALLVLGLTGLLLSAYRHAGASESVRAIARIVSATAISIAVTLLIIEVLLRAFLYAAGSRDQKIMYLYSLAEIRALQSNIMPMPYISYVPDPAYDGHNALGYRGPEIAVPKLQGTFRIVALGGSTTYSTGTSAEESYPAFLQSILRADYGYSGVEVVNAGVSGYTSWEALASFAFRILELEPDMLIYYGGVNDLVVRERLSNDCYRGLNPQRGLNGNRGQFVERNAELPASALYRLIAILSGWMSNPLSLDSSFEPSRVECDPDPGATTLEMRLAANSPHYFERNIRNMLTLALANNAQPVVSSWIYNVEADRPELWRQSIAEHNDVTRRIAADMDIPYIDLAAEFPVKRDYWEVDGIHLVAAGAYEQASRYAAALDDLGLLPAPSDNGSAAG